MNKKGFTLVELLAVIIIIALIALISVPKVKEIIDEQTSKTNLTYMVKVKELFNEYLLENNKVSNELTLVNEWINMGELIDIEKINLNIDKKNFDKIYLSIDVWRFDSNTNTDKFPISSGLIPYELIGKNSKGCYTITSSNQVSYDEVC